MSEIQENAALATEDPTGGHLEATEFPEDEFPDPIEGAEDVNG